VNFRSVMRGGLPSVGISGWQPREVPRNNLKLTVVGGGDPVVEMLVFGDCEGIVVGPKRKWQELEDSA